MLRSLCVGLLGVCALVSAQSNENTINHIISQAVRTFEILQPGEYPAETTLASNGTWELSTAASWTSGFFPGIFWQLYNFTGDAQWMEIAIKLTEGIRDQQYNNGTHDLGFMIYDSFGLGWEFAQVPGYDSVIHTAANTLATRYNPIVGMTRSWDFAACNNPGWDTRFPVIIDNMMNMELLLWSSQNGGDPENWDRAVSHTDRTIEHHVREDGGTYHVVDFIPETGEVFRPCTHQGFSVDSTWSRGHSWAIYGFTAVYRYTQEPRHLEAARLTADYFLERTTREDGIPNYDFDSPYIQRDSSAAAVTASALIELSSHIRLTDPVASENYLNEARKIVNSLNTQEYLTNPDDTRASVKWACKTHLDVLPGIEVDRSLIYSGYYLLEAIVRLERLLQG